MKKVNSYVVVGLSLLWGLSLFAQQPEEGQRRFPPEGAMPPLREMMKMMSPTVDPSFQPRHWGDQGNGTFINPVLNADYSDPDVIRVGDTYYMVASDFHFVGMQILRSKDMVGWDVVARIYEGFDFPGWDTNDHYGEGSWAPSIRYHDGRFYVYFCTPSEGLFMTSAPSAEGPWEPLHFVHEGTGRGWEDPCPFWDEDGNAYLGRSQVGAGPIIIHRMSPDGKTLLDEGVTVYEGPTAEGTKIHKWNGYYYISIPEGGVGAGNQVCLRSASIYGPYDKKVVLETGASKVNGPHQGAIVDTPDGKWWFFHFQQTPILGRVVHLQPMTWQDGWPVIGVDIDRNGIGEPVYVWEKPVQGKVMPKPATSDSFNGEAIGLQWQYNHNPLAGKLSLSARNGWLSHQAAFAPSFKKARNTIAQKMMGYSGCVTVKLDLSKMADGEFGGLAAMGMMDYALSVKKENGKRYLVLQEVSMAGWGQWKDTEVGGKLPLKGSGLYLRMEYDVYEEDAFQCFYSFDGKSFQPFGEPFFTCNGNWKGVRFALFNYNTVADGGTMFFDDFVYKYDEL